MKIHISQETNWGNMNIKELVYQRYPHKTGLSQISSHNLFITDILTKLVYHRYPQKWFITNILTKMVYHRYPQLKKWFIKYILNQMSSNKELVYHRYPHTKMVYHIYPQLKKWFIKYILNQYVLKQWTGLSQISSHKNGLSHISSQRKDSNYLKHNFISSAVLIFKFLTIPSTKLLLLETGVLTCNHGNWSPSNWNSANMAAILSTWWLPSRFPWKYEYWNKPAANDEY